MKIDDKEKQQNCGKSDCACASQKNLPIKNETHKEEPQIEQDPTRFGDWQVNGRAIDF